MHKGIIKFLSLSGALLRAVFTLPNDCKGNKLCTEAKAILPQDTKLYLEGKIGANGMKLKANYKGTMKIQGDLQLTDISLVVSVGTETEIYFEVALKLKEPKIAFKGSESSLLLTILMPCFRIASEDLENLG